MYEVKNISDILIVCTLADGSTLRLGLGETKQVRNKDMTDYLFNIEKKGFIKIRKKTTKK